MRERDDAARLNRRWWQKMVREGNGFTRPWLDLERSVVERFARGGLRPVPEPLIDLYPASVFADVAGRDVLCLASGGGQQSAVFGLLGARVTVVDLSEGQLEGDRAAAARYGYAVTTIQADMRDLSRLEDESFDLVYQPPSLAYVPDVRPVYAEVARVLRAGGTYRVEVGNPATEYVDFAFWDKGYRIDQPYSVAMRRTEAEDGEAKLEYRHYFQDIFGGLLELGLCIRDVRESPRHRMHDPAARPGSWEHWLEQVQTQLAIVATKQ